MKEDAFFAHLTCYCSVHKAKEARKLEKVVLVRYSCALLLRLLLLQKTLGLKREKAVKVKSPIT